jgi:glycine/D-amino acid oxidase-like deaminating enzyme
MVMVMVAAGNGHAFKLGPMIGKMLAELALRGTCTYDNTEFLLTRPALRPAAKL